MDSRTRTTMSPSFARVRERILALAIGMLLVLLIAGGVLLVIAYPQLKLDWMRRRADAHHQVILDELAAGQSGTWSGRFDWITVSSTPTCSTANMASSR